MFKAIPDGGDVKLTLSNESVELTDLDDEDEDTIGEPEIPSAIGINADESPSSNDDLKLMYRSGELRFELPAGSGRDVNVSVYSTTGVALATYEIRNMSHRKGSVRMPEEFERPGICIVRVNDINKTWSGKLVL
jgi:hypothetical protein